MAMVTDPRLLDWPEIERKFRAEAPQDFPDVDLAVRALKRLYDEKKVEFYIGDDDKLHAVHAASLSSH